MLEAPIQQNTEQNATLADQNVAPQSLENETSPYADTPVRDTPVPSAPGVIDTPPLPPSRPPYDPSNGGQPEKPARKPWRFPAIMALAILLVFGGGLVAGQQIFVHTSGSSTTTGTAPTQQVMPAQSSSSGSNIETQREAAISKVRGAIVEVKTTTAQGEGIGSGVVIDKNGYIVTNNHVVEGAQTVKVTLADGTSYNATVTGTDPADDLAVLKINPPANLVVATLGDSSKLVVGQEVLAIGNPLGITQTVTHGIVSALSRTMSESGSSRQAGATIPNMIQTDAPINPGNSGGALIDLNGNVVGMPTLGATNTETNTSANGLGFAIPSSRINFIAQQIIKDGKVTHTGRAALGVSAATVNARVQAQESLSVDSGAYIVNVSSGSAAAQAGIKTGDVIVKVDDQAIDSSDTLGQVLATKNPGDQVKITVARGNQQLTLTVTLGELAASS